MHPNLALVKALEANDKFNQERICENKEVDTLLLAIDKFFYWNPFMDFRGEEALGECNWATDVWRKQSWTPSGQHIPTHAINPLFVSFGKVQ